MVSKERARTSKVAREMGDQYQKALAEATDLYEKALEFRKMGGIGADGARAICDLVNQKYLTKFEKKLSKTTLIRYQSKGISVPSKRGPPAKISDNLIECLSLHAAMMQVSGRGEVKPRDFLGVIGAAVKIQSTAI